MSADGDTPSGPEPAEESHDMVVRLRARAAELRGEPAAAPDADADDADNEGGADTESRVDTDDQAHADADEDGQADAADDEGTTDTDTAEPDSVGDEFGDTGSEELDTSELLRRWSEEDHVESVSPRRNWTPLVVLVVVAALGGLVAAAFWWVGNSDDGPAATGRTADEARAGSVLDEELPTLDDLTADVTIPPGPAEGLLVADKGVTVVEDRFDPAVREGTFAVVVDNPHPGWLAQGVQVDVDFLGADGTVLGTDNGFLEVVLPEQTVAVASHFFDAPVEPVVDLAVRIDVARWRETERFDGSFETADVVTEEAEFSGLRTSFLLRSDFDRTLEDVGVTAVYRDAEGRIVGGYDTFVELVEPGVDTPAEIALLANIALDRVATTDLYPYAGFGFVPDEE